MRFITLPTGEHTSITVDVARIVAVEQLQTRVRDDSGDVFVDGKYQYMLDDTRCDVAIDGYREGSDGCVTSSVRVTMSCDQVMKCVYGFDNSRNYRTQDK